MEIDRLIAFADELVVAAKGEGLDYIQRAILQQTLEGRRLKDVQIGGYTIGYIQTNLAPNLWNLLSEVTGEAVKFKTVEIVLSTLLKRRDKLQFSPASLIREKEKNGQKRLMLSPETTSEKNAEKTVSGKESTGSLASTRSRPYHNLPALDRQAFVGRTAEISHLLTLLKSDRQVYRIGIEGMGGTGKTALALEAANYCLQASCGQQILPIAPIFDAIIFASAKQQYLTADGILPSQLPRRTQRDLFRTIARTLDCPQLLQADFEEQLECILEQLSQKRTLLIVDNLETAEEADRILSFLCELPLTVKTIVTSRIHIKLLDIARIHLEGLSEAEGLYFIELQCREKSVPLKEEERLSLYQKTGGIPAAIVYTMGQLSIGYPLEIVLERLANQQGNLARFCLEASMSLLDGHPGYTLLMALSIFPSSATAEAIAWVANMKDAVEIAEGWVKLKQLSLVSDREGRYSIIPLTCSYAIEALKQQPNFEETAKNRWVDWYVKWIENRKSGRPKEWEDDSDIEVEWENLVRVIEWCIDRDRYENVKQFWRSLKSFSYSLGYDNDRLKYWRSPLEWTEWLLRSAKQRNDRETAAEVLFDRGWTLTLMGQDNHLEAAEPLLLESWQLREAKDSHFQIDLGLHIGAYYIERRQFETAKQWCDRVETLLNESKLPASQSTRFWLHLDYNQGSIAYQTENYDGARLHFDRVLERALKINWKRAIALAKHWLADIAIQQNNLEEAQNLLEEGLQMAKENNDKCRQAFCQRSRSRLAWKQGYISEAIRWAKVALDCFLHLGAISEVEATRAWIQQLQEHRSR